MAMTTTPPGKKNSLAPDDVSDRDTCLSQPKLRLRKDGGVDRRQFNTTPDHSKFGAGGRKPDRGRGSAAAAHPNPLDEAYSEELSRTVPGFGGAEVPFYRRVVQTQIGRAADGKDPQAERHILDRLDLAFSRTLEIQRAQALDIAWVMARHSEIADEFYYAQKRGMEPPDIIPHPAHVHINDMSVEILGPTSLEGREIWEFLKLAVKARTGDVQSYRALVRADPDDDEAREWLRFSQSYRRQLMRFVPKGWDWREDIFSLGLAPEYKKALQAMGKVK
jgi:hypothetical protein